MEDDSGTPRDFSAARHERRLNRPSSRRSSISDEGAAAIHAHTHTRDALMSIASPQARAATIAPPATDVVLHIAQGKLARGVIAPDEYAQIVAVHQRQLRQLSSSPPVSPASSEEGTLPWHGSTGSVDGSVGSVEGSVGGRARRGPPGIESSHAPTTTPLRFAVAAEQGESSAWRDAPALRTPADVLSAMPSSDGAPSAPGARGIPGDFLRAFDNYDVELAEDIAMARALSRDSSI